MPLQNPATAPKTIDSRHKARAKGATVKSHSENAKIKNITEANNAPKIAPPIAPATQRKNIPDPSLLIASPPIIAQYSARNSRTAVSRTMCAFRIPGIYSSCPTFCGWDLAR
jgi:hypothetical protein